MQSWDRREYACLLPPLQASKTRYEFTYPHIITFNPTYIQSGHFQLSFSLNLIFSIPPPYKNQHFAFISDNDGLGMVYETLHIIIALFNMYYYLFHLYHYLIIAHLSHLYPWQRRGGQLDITSLSHHHCHFLSFIIIFLTFIFDKEGMVNWTLSHHLHSTTLSHVVRRHSQPATIILN